VEDADQAITRVLRMVLEGQVASRTGADLAIRADTVCLHGDQPKALMFAHRLREALLKAGVAVRRLGEAGRRLSLRG